jgi:hypothetical protein
MLLKVEDLGDAKGKIARLIYINMGVFHNALEIGSHAAQNNGNAREESAACLQTKK